MAARGGPEAERRRRGAETRAALIAAARELFVTQGYYETSTEEIVATAGVGTRGAFYHHFADKRDLFAAVYEAVEDDLIARSVTAARRLPEDTWDRLVASLHGFLSAAMEPEVQQIILTDGAAVLGWNKRRELEGRRSLPGVIEALTLAMKEGTIRRQPPRELARLIMAAVEEAALLVAHAPRPRKALKDASAALDGLLNGLRVSA